MIFRLATQIIITNKTRRELKALQYCGDLNLIGHQFIVGKFLANKVTARVSFRTTTTRRGVTPRIVVLQMFSCCWVTAIVIKICIGMNKIINVPLPRDGVPLDTRQRRQSGHGDKNLMRGETETDRINWVSSVEETGLVSLDGKWRGIANVLLSQFIVGYPPPPIHLKHNRHGHGQDSGLASMWSFNWKRGLTRECLLNSKNPELIPRKILCQGYSDWRIPLNYARIVV